MNEPNIETIETRMVTLESAKGTTTRLLAGTIEIDATERENTWREWLNETPTTGWHMDGELCCYTNENVPVKRRLQVLNAEMVPGNNLTVNDRPLQWIMYKVRYEGDNEAEDTLVNLGNVWYGTPVGKEADCRVQKCKGCATAVTWNNNSNKYDHGVVMRKEDDKHWHRKGEVIQLNIIESGERHKGKKRGTKTENVRVDQVSFLDRNPLYHGGGKWLDLQ